MSSTKTEPALIAPPSSDKNFHADCDTYRKAKEAYRKFMQEASALTKRLHDTLDTLHQEAHSQWLLDTLEELGKEVDDARTTILDDGFSYLWQSVMPTTDSQAEELIEESLQGDSP